MSIIRMIYCTFAPDQVELAERNWKEECAPIIIRQDGCITEQLLRCTNAPGEFISYSEWEDEESIGRYLNSDDHQEIKRHNRNIKGADVAVKHYTTVA